ncbi:MAG: hypothetical protein ACLSAP_04335 [Oscillospiraceae bacterium]
MEAYIKALQGPAPASADIVRLLQLEDFSEVYRAADAIRAARKGNVVQIRSILEFSNHCVRQCAYCGLNRQRPCSALPHDRGGNSRFGG